MRVMSRRLDVRTTVAETTCRPEPVRPQVSPSGTIVGMPPLQPVELTAGRYLLRPWRRDDVDAVWAALQDPDTRLWNGGGVTCRADAEGLVARRADWSSGDHASWAVVDGTGVVGSVSLHSIDPVQNDAEIGYWTTPVARGQGVAAVAVDAACRWAFATLPVDRIELCHAVENIASGRVAEKAGFTREGRLRRSYRYGDGVKHDELLWARLADDPAPVLSSRS
jgi:RimJ/RimL family protein N-acetyltransferase